MATTHDHAAHSHVAETDLIGGKIAGFGCAYAITAIFNAIVVILKESFPAVHDTMAAITGHHWVTHGLLDLIVFVAFGLYLGRSDGLRITGNALAAWIVGCTVAGGLLIVGYFVV